MNILHRICVAAGLALSLILSLAAFSSTAVADEATVHLDIKSQPLGAALNAFARQSGLQVFLSTEDGSGIVIRKVSGTFTPKAALDALLSGTGLGYEFLNARTVAVRPKGQAGERAQEGAASRAPADHGGNAMRLAVVETGAPVATTASKEEGGSDDNSGRQGSDSGKGIPEMLVKGARTSNTDIRRTEDDVQPYVVFDAEEIERSMAPDLETFLSTRLTMNQSRGSEGQNLDSFRGNQSTIDLRGLGADQTLILVNGRRMPGVGSDAEFYQPDINGIPISAVERIEILPSTAGGIYGGGATGGVVNIILKRNYSNLELTARYDGTFAGGGAQRRLDATAGFSLEGGRTNVMLTASYRDGQPMYVRDRNFAARARALQNQNNPAAFYASGTPVHGYTTNIRSVSGRDLVLTDELRSLNSRVAHVPVGYAGPDSDNGAALLGTADEYNLALAEDPVGNEFSLLNTPTVRSLQLSLRREFTARIEAFADVSRYDNRAVRMGSSDVFRLVNVVLPVGSNNPFTEAVRLSVPLVGYEQDRLRTAFASLSEQLTSGLIVRLPREWTVQGEYSLGRSKSTRQYPRDVLTADGAAALIDGRFDPLSDVNAYPLDFTAFYPDESSRSRVSWKSPMEREGATLRVSGPLLTLPGGPLRLAALVERQEQFSKDQIYAAYPGGTGTPSFSYYPEMGSSTDSGYAELNAPLVSAINARPGLLGFDLLASYRYDATKTRTRPVSEWTVDVPSPEGPFPEVPFQTNKVTGNQYTLGLRYLPVESVALRLSYGEGILPPSPFDLSDFEFPTLFLSFNVDPKRGGLPVDIDTVERYSLLGSVLLRPERSASWSGGMIFTPANLPGFRLSVDYTRIEKTDEIGTLDTQVLLDLEDDFPGVIVRNELTAADAALGYTGGTIRVVNAGYVNIARSLMEALDIQADYTWQTRFGSFAANLMATVQPGLSQQPTPDSEESDLVGYSNGPIKWRANAGLRFSRGAMDLGWNLQYYDAYRVYTSYASDASRSTLVLGQGSEWIPTQTYHDVYGRYRFGNAPGFASGLLENTELQLSIQNVLNTSPPIRASSSAYVVGGYATEGNARLRRYSIAFSKRFGK